MTSKGLPWLTRIEYAYKGETVSSDDMEYIQRKRG